VRVGIVVFPGTNCDQDVEQVYGRLLGATTVRIWHRDSSVGDVDAVVLPGGFSYGDYLRTGALAKLSPVMRSVKEFAQRGGKVIGICNGFQILCEAGLLPGVLLENVGLRFLSRFVHIRVDSSQSFFTQGLVPGSVITCPIAHFQGNYFADADTIQQLEANQQVVFRYCDQTGQRADGDRNVNVNGSRNSIAGITNATGNVVGLMPHPERAVELLTGFVGGSTGLSPFAATVGSAERAMM
jgi:phosphoribosylformylglycinamidine synthase I